MEDFGDASFVQNEGLNFTLVAKAWLSLFQSGGELLKALRRGALASGSAVGWQQEWGQRVLPLLDGLKRG
jgi:hypothetical protein